MQCLNLTLELKQLKLEEQQSKDDNQDVAVVKLENDMALMKEQIVELGKANSELEKLARAKVKNLEEAQSQLKRKEKQL